MDRDDELHIISMDRDDELHIMSIISMDRDDELHKNSEMTNDGKLRAEPNIDVAILVRILVFANLENKKELAD
jgi:hypothetical protein